MNEILLLIFDLKQHLNQQAESAKDFLNIK